MLIGFRQEQAAKAKKYLVWTISQVASRVQYAKAVLAREKSGTTSTEEVVKWFLQVSVAEDDQSYSLAAIRVYDALQEELFSAADLKQLSSIQTQSFKFGALDVYLQQGPTYLIRSFHA